MTVKLFSYFLLFFTLLACNSSKVQTDSSTIDEIQVQKSEEVISEEKNEVKEDIYINPDKLTNSYFASGCFWCVEAIYEHTIGVQEVYSGYSGGHTKNPTYESSNTGKTGHAEAVRVVYDSSIISFEQLVDIYFATQNIEQVNGQGPDNGSQYRSIIFYTNANEKEVIETKISKLKNKGLKPAAEVKKFEKFWMAEDYHQDYERLHPNQPYIRSVSVPRLNRFKKTFPELVK